MKCQAHLRPRQSIRSLARQARAGLEHTLRVRVILPACRPTSPGRGYHPAQPSAAGAHGSAARSPPLGRAALPGPGRSAPAAQRGEDAQVLGTQAAGGPPGLDQLRKHVVGLHELLRRRHPPRRITHGQLRAGGPAAAFPLHPCTVSEQRRPYLQRFTVRVFSGNSLTKSGSDVTAFGCVVE